MCQLPSNLGTSTSWNPQSLSKPVQGLIYLYYWKIFCFHTLGSAGEIKTQWEGHSLLTDLKKAFAILVQINLILPIQLRISVNPLNTDLNPICQ